MGPCGSTRCFWHGTAKDWREGIGREDKGFCCYLPDEINFLFFILAGSKSWNCCQTSGAGLHPKRRLGAGTSHGEWVHDEEPFTEAANYETTADAGMMPRASVGSCAIHLTGRDRTNWNGETNSQQTLRSDPGAAGLSQSRAVLPERPRPSAAQQVRVQLCPLMCKGRIQSPPYHCRQLWSASELGGKTLRREA